MGETFAQFEKGTEEASQITQKVKENNSTYWNNICAIELKQTRKGIKEYGMTLEENQLVSVLDRLDFIQEELVDALKYIEWVKDGLRNIMQEESYGDK